MTVNPAHTPVSYYELSVIETWFEIVPFLTVDVNAKQKYVRG